MEANVGFFCISFNLNTPTHFKMTILTVANTHKDRRRINKDKSLLDVQLDTGYKMSN